jgi:transposase-like protein
MQRNRYTSEFKEQALSKVRQRGSRTLEAVANELNLSLGSLKGWLKAANHKVADSITPASLPSDTAAHLWSPAQRLLALNESHALQGAALHAWCREKGLFEHQLKQWREAFCSTSEPNAHQAKAELRDLKVKHEQLQRDLRRKDRALAETAALLVLQKKFRALLEDEDK